MRNGLTRRPNNLLDSFLNEDFVPRFTYGHNLDIYREADRYIVEIDTPGFNKEDINVEFKGDMLSITAEQKTSDEKEDESKNYYYRSRSYKSLNRQFRFNDIDAGSVDATYENGVLKVVLPTLNKTETVNRIAVK